MMVRHTRVATLAVGALLASVSVSGCEQTGDLRSSTRAGVRLSDGGAVQVLTFGCVGDPIREVRATDGRGGVLWSAKPSRAPEGPVEVSSPPGGTPGWTNIGRVQASDRERRTFMVRTDRDGFQNVEAVPAELPDGRVVVDPASFGGQTSVTLDEFNRVNRQRCNGG